MFDASGKRVLILGDIMLDVYSEGAVARVSPEAPVPVVLLRDEKFVPGGAANVAANVAALGANAELIGVIGQDAYGDRLLETLSSSFDRIDLAHLVRVDSRPTTTKTRVIGNRAQVARLDREDASPLGREIEDRVIEAARLRLPFCDVVVVSDYSKGVCTDRVLRGVIKLASSANKPLLVDPKRTDFSIYRGATIIKPNLKELEAATCSSDGSDLSVEKAAESLAVLTGADLVVTRSEKGMSYISASCAPIHIPTAARNVFDVSGAGDTVMAALAVLLNFNNSSEGIAHALSLANAAAGVVVGKQGTATVTPQEISKYINAERIKKLTAEKIVTRSEAKSISDSWRSQGLMVGFTNGCFDLLHPGHIQLLEKSAENCDRLIVALNSDLSVSRLKGPHRPVQKQNARARVMAALGMVDLVVIFEEETPAELIEELMPEILIKGSDYTLETVVGANVVTRAGGQVLLVDLIPDSSTTALIHKSSGGIKSLL